MKNAGKIEVEYLDAHQSLAEARIARKSVEQQLHTLGCSEEELRTLPDCHRQFEIVLDLAV